MGYPIEFDKKELLILEQMIVHMTGCGDPIANDKPIWSALLKIRFALAEYDDWECKQKGQGVR